MRYRKKPVVIEAVQLRWDTWNEMCEFVGVGKLVDGKPEGCYVREDGTATSDFPGETAKIGLHIPTLEGLMLGVEGDWIIRGVRGELYPCKPDIFEATYEPSCGRAANNGRIGMTEAGAIMVMLGVVFLVAAVGGAVGGYVYWRLFRSQIVKVERKQAAAVSRVGAQPTTTERHGPASREAASATEGTVT